MKICRLILSGMFLFITAGCADIEIPKTKEILKEPLGKVSVDEGMSKTEVVSIYGEPDVKSIVVSEGWNKPREEWFYRARYPVIPVNTGYLSDDLYLYFDGDSLTNISKSSLGEKSEKSQERVGANVEDDTENIK